jgi:GntR family transcriptional regulator
LLLREEKAGPGVARALEIDEGHPVIHWQRLRLADGEPTCLSDVYLSSEMFAAFMDSEPPESLYAWFESIDMAPNWGEDAVQAGGASELEADQLGISVGAPVLRVSRRAFSREIACEVSRNTYRADRFTLWVPVLRAD